MRALRACSLVLAAALLAGCGALLPRVDRYDASRDAQRDVEAALRAAPWSGRQVLVTVGGDWCKDCRDLDALFAADPSLAALRDARFIPVKLYLGSDNRNEAALARFPKLSWVPTLYVLEADGRVVRHAPSTAFHEGTRLDPTLVRRFLAGDAQGQEAHPWK